MNLPNLLNLALNVVPKQTVQWYRATGRSTGETGYDVTTFAPPVAVSGSFQIVSHDKFEQMGLDFKREYVKFYVSMVLGDLERDMTGDQFTFAGARYQVMANEDWYAVNGWNASMAVKLTT